MASKCLKMVDEHLFNGQKMTKTKNYLNNDPLKEPCFFFFFKIDKLLLKFNSCAHPFIMSVFILLYRYCNSLG